MVFGGPWPACGASISVGVTRVARTRERSVARCSEPFAWVCPSHAVSGADWGWAGRTFVWSVRQVWHGARGGSDTARAVAVSNVASMCCVLSQSLGTRLSGLPCPGHGAVLTVSVWLTGNDRSLILAG